MLFLIRGTTQVFPNTTDYVLQKRPRRFIYDLEAYLSFISYPWQRFNVSTLHVHVSYGGLIRFVSKISRDIKDDII